MNLPIPALPTARRDDLGHACANNLMGIKARTGLMMPVEILLHMAFTSGYEAAKIRRQRELLVEAWICGTPSMTWMAKRRGRFCSTTW